MENSISIADLFDHHEDRLGLKWIAGDKGKNTLLKKKQIVNSYTSPM